MVAIDYNVLPGVRRNDKLGRCTERTTLPTLQTCKQSNNKYLKHSYKYLLFLILCVVSSVSAKGRPSRSPLPNGGVFSRSGSPYVIREEVVVEEGQELTVDPGVTLQFDPGVGITVRGVLKAVGTPSDRILFTSSQPPTSPLPQLGVRLVDGATPLVGRLQIHYKHQWRSVCTNSRNWTAADLTVTCRQLGFTGGYFYEWQDKANNDTKSLLLEAPSCGGEESSLQGCQWDSRSLGGGVCDLHPDLGVACGEYHADWRPRNYWKGIHFDDSSFTQELEEQKIQYLKISQSLLSYVDIEHAGYGPNGEVVAAVHAFRTPPRMDHFSVSGSVYTGINFTMPGTYVKLNAATVINNRGYGIYVNSSTGGVELEGKSLVSNNQADGVKYFFHQREPIKSADESFLDLCRGSYTDKQTYPLVMKAEQERNVVNPQTCDRTFYTLREDYVFTLHFNYMLTDDDSASSIEVRDLNKYGEILAQFNLRNHTYPPSVVSRTNKLYVKYKADGRKQSIIYMEVVAGKVKIPDLSLNGTTVANNSGHGVSVENLRSAVYIHKSNLTANYFGSGLNVRRGAGDVNITYSTVTNNFGDGVNVTYEGGMQNVTWSRIADNKLRGVALWFNETGQNSSVRQETGVAHSQIINNLETGVLVGNFCTEAVINITMNSFLDGKEAAVEVGSCWNKSENFRHVHITHNLFERNERLAIKIAPAANMNLTIEWNEFYENRRGTLLIKNKDLVELDLLPLTGRIAENIFRRNTGRYVMLLSLTTPGIFQSLLVTRNTLQNNLVMEPYSTMTSRSHAAGVICVGSVNIKIYRNLLENPLSSYEMSSHSLDQSAPINATYNWLGKQEETDIFERLLDRRDRYNLALIIFHPYLLSNNNMETPVVSTGQMNEPDFYNPVNKKIIGGEVNGHIVLKSGVYTVVKDIYVHNTGELTIAFGATLEFAESIGVMVAGQIRTEGSTNNEVRFTLSGTTQAEEQIRQAEQRKIEEQLARERAENEIEEATDNDYNVGELTERTMNITEFDMTPEMKIKLVGNDGMEGRLMLYSEGEWGTVCTHGWTEDTAAVACQQLGYVLNPEDWLLLPGDLTADGADAAIVRGNIRCDEFDTDISSCRSDSREELENSCSHADDVGLRCYPQSWAGIRLGITAKESHMKGVIIEKAGLLDYSTRSFKPALQVDFHQHVLQDLTVRMNSHDGIGVIYSNQYAISNPAARVFKNCDFYRNKRHGLSFRQLGANVTDSKLSYNGGSGLHFNPMLSRPEQRELTGWLKLLHKQYTLIPGAPSRITLEKDRPLVLMTKTLKNLPEEQQTILFTTYDSNVIGIQVLAPIDIESTEKIIFFDYQEMTTNKDVSRWDLREDQGAFPTTTTSYSLTMHYTSGNLALGDAIILLTAVDRRHIAQAGDLRNFRSKWPMVFLEDSLISHNDIGISTLHYNRYLTEEDDHLLRSFNETIQIVNCQINDNENEAVFVLSPFRVDHDNEDMGEFTMMINKTEIMNNGRGIAQRSWDVRNSNNLFNWVFESVKMEGNSGGVSLTLPYVWKFNENFTHTIYVNQSSFSKNTGFEFTVDGHFAKVNITFSKFEENTCKYGAMAMRGMEKEMFIYDNSIVKNVGTYMVEFNMDSQSSILGDLYAYFEYNTVQKNRHIPLDSIRTKTYQPASTAISVRGLQKINITHNLLGENEMDYELLAGLYTAKINNVLNVEGNWWGSSESDYIQERIFDFNDWNNYAIADYMPFLTSNNIRSEVKSSNHYDTEHAVDFDNLGGQLKHDLDLPFRPQAYTVKSDLTVMPGITLTVRPGVIIEFYPSVGILVLGRLLSVGLRGNHIIFRPVDSTKAQHYRVSRSVPLNPKFRLALEDSGDRLMERNKAKRSIHSSRSFREHIDVRLCVEGDCNNRRDGFLDLFNSTTQQWVPVCDERFTERNAQVVCQQLGYNKVHFFMGRNKRTEMYPNALLRVRTWPEPIQCQGNEGSLTDCPIRMNGQIFDHRYQCSWNGDFVYISCGDTHLPEKETEYWGGIRFSIPSFEHSRVYSRIHDPHTHHHGPYNSSAWASILEWTDIIGAGMLHNEFSPAILALHDAPRLRGVTVKYSAYDGVSLISCVDPFEMLYNKFEHNLGFGISIMGLTGETRESAESSFAPLSNLRLPYHVFGMLDICDSAKEMRVEERLLLYYKYDNKPVDCVKIFSSVYDVKNFGIRFLQFNLFNSTWEPVNIPDRIVLYDGDVYNETSTILDTLHANTTNHMSFFKTVGTRLSVELHATGASGSFGFIAEILTLPISNIGISRNVHQNFTYNQFYNNEEGAMFVSTAGEVNPWLTISWSRIEHNGLQLYGNFTTSRAALYFDIQNMQEIYIKNNLLRNNTGGAYILSGSLGAATKLQANITNNLFYETKHWPALYIESRDQSAYQHALIEHNDFSWSYSPYHDVITLAQIISDFSYNYAHNNIGRHILDIYGFEKVRRPVYQTTSHNSLAYNQAVDPTYQGTIIAGSAGQQFVDNVFYNWDNAYELVAVNETVRCNISTECAESTFYKPDPFAYYQRSDVWKTPIDARNNWWGFNTTVAVSGRIHDKLDDISLLSVNFSHYKLNNYTLLFGCEPGYTLVGDSCYLYIGAPVTYAEAKAFCRRDNASLPFLQKYYGEVQIWMREMQPEYLWQTDAVWVQHYDVLTGCAAFVNRQVRSLDCSLNLPFICESDPDNTIDPLAWATDTLVLSTIAALIGCIIMIIACVSCWGCKSKHRRKERMVRKNSIRASIRSNRSVMSSTSGYSDGDRRILENPGARVLSMKNSATTSTLDGATGLCSQPSGSNGHHMNGALSGSLDSIAKEHLDALSMGESYAPYERSEGGHNYNVELDNRYAHDPALENATINMMVQPTFDTTYQNDFYRDNSTNASRHQLWDNVDNNQPTSYGYSSFNPRGSQVGPPTAPKPVKPGQQYWSRPNVFDSPNSTTSSYRHPNGSVGGESTQNLAGAEVYPAQRSASGSVGSTGGGSTAGVAYHDVTPPDEMYNAATLPRDMAPPRYSSEDALHKDLPVDEAMRRSVDDMITRGGGLPLETLGTRVDDDNSRSCSQPLETAM